MYRRELLRGGAGIAAGTAIAGCSGFTDALGNDASDEPLPIRLTALDVLNRRDAAYTFHLGVEYEGKVIKAISRDIPAPSDPSHPTSVELSDWPDEKGKYEFALRLDTDDTDWVRVRPTKSGTDPKKANCYRLTYLIDLGGDIFPYAQKNCDG